MAHNDDRLSLRINSQIKSRAQAKLEAKGLNLTDYLRMIVTNLANDDTNVEVKLK